MLVVDEQTKKDLKETQATKRAFSLNKDEWLLMTVGFIGAAASGALWPIFSLVFAEITVVLVSINSDKSDIRYWALMFIVLALAFFVATFAMFGGLETSAARLTQKLRGLTFETILYQDMSFFDRPEHSVGALTSVLSKDASQVSGITGSKFGTIIQCISTLLCGLIISFIATWKLTLVTLTVIPLIALSGYMEIRMMDGFSSKNGDGFAAAGQIASEATDNRRTVASLNQGEHFLDKYMEALDGPIKSAKKSAVVAGLGFGVAEFAMFAIWAISFYYGSVLIERGEVSFLDVMKSISALLFGAMTIGNAFAMMPDASTARSAAINVFKLVDIVPLIDVRDTSGDKPGHAEGLLEYEELVFEYPTRQSVPVLRKLTVTANPGETMALVGESGCGKSTLVGLTERFYDPRSGEIKLDGNPIKTLNLRWLRSQIGIVSQEPDLFRGSVRENIAYGLGQEEGTVVTDELIHEAAKLANAHNFIMELPSGYDTDVGERGGELSGGQRQRVAIARALVRNPRILLLDEATSALDVASEQVVQEALERAAKGRTTIVVAHRLSTIQTADKIAVVAAGKAVEQGSHGDLMRKNGAYNALVKSQTQR
mmetsp:Transcript_11552/g.29204  ORF Transcript_11552/g.29204 Transcript_11552/m.29204 type:complete len:599 (-) Transcript_11552:47-1843(-)